MATKLVFDAEKGGSLIVIFPDGGFFVHSSPHNKGGKMGKVVERCLQNDDWVNRQIARLSEVEKAEEREELYQKMRKEPVKTK